MRHCHKVMQKLLTVTFKAFRDGVNSPQAVTAHDLLTGVKGGALWMHPIWVVLGACGYLILKDILKRICTSLDTNGKSKSFKQLALVHNVALCLFSLVSSVNVWYMTISHAKRYGIENVYCERQLWENGLKLWGFLFYLSKYWELIDTFLLVWKRRTPSFLQVYHHLVTLLCAYMLQASHSSVTFLFIGLNATVHTVMYAYYALTIMGIRFKAKSMITVMQIVQFIIGNMAALLMFVLRGGDCACESQKIAVGAIVIHAFVLIGLFVNFYFQTYVRTKKIKST